MMFKKDTVQPPVRKKHSSSLLPLSLMAAPGMLYLLINNYIPMFGLFIAFKKIDYAVGIFKSKWVGFSNFKFLFATKDAFIITRNTVLYNLSFIILTTVLGVMVGIMLSEVRSRKLTKFFQTSILLPKLISVIIIANIVFAYLSNETGLINKTILPMLGMDPINFYTEPIYWVFILPFTHTWQWLGYSAVIYFAAVIGIDSQLYEAAVIDGASKRQQILSITLPMLKPTIITLFLLSVGRIFHADFGLFYQVPMNSGPLFNVTNVIDTYVYRSLMELNNIAMASAAGAFQSVVGFCTVMLANYVVKRLDRESAMF